VGIAQSATGWTVWVRITSEAILFSSPQCPDRLGGPPSLLSNGYRRLFPRAQIGRGVKLTTYLHLVPRSRMVELYRHFYWTNRKIFNIRYEEHIRSIEYNRADSGYATHILNNAQCYGKI
jgi:hypothetical protein